MQTVEAFSEAIRGHQRSSDVIRGRQWSSEGIRRHQRPPKLLPVVDAFPHGRNQRSSEATQALTGRWRLPTRPQSEGIRGRPSSHRSLTPSHTAADEVLYARWQLPEASSHEITTCSGLSA